MKNYLILDIGTGNVRVALTDENGTILTVERDNVDYASDNRYANALCFDPVELWSQIIVLTKRVLKNVPGANVKAITASSQREGIVLLGHDGASLIGLPNHDHRGREWENSFSEKDKDFIYKLAGRYPSSLFSALKLVGVRNKHPEIFEKTATIVSISDWAQYMLCGVAGYEHSQASETLLYDVAQKKWSKEACSIFGIDETLLPPLHSSGSILGNIKRQCAGELNISQGTPVIVGGADTQLAIKSTQPSVEDIVIVSGTTTPVVKIINEYIVDDKQRTWTNRHIENDTFILETNAGVTGLNYQRLKEIFYPTEGYAVMEKEITALEGLQQCTASLGSLIADEKTPMIRGGFIFDVPVSEKLPRAAFMQSVLWDIACCIKENYDNLCDMIPYQQDYVWACGGGMQSRILRQYIAGLINKKVMIREGYNQASVSGGALICKVLLGTSEKPDAAVEVTYPNEPEHFASVYQEWKKVRTQFRKIQ